MLSLRLVDLEWDKTGFICSPCSFFKSAISGGNTLLQVTSWSNEIGGGKKLYDQIPEHDWSGNFLQWYAVEWWVLIECSIDIQLEKEILSEVDI